jgi:magnesium transporter
MNPMPVSVLDHKHGSQPLAVPSNFGKSQSESVGAHMVAATVCYLSDTAGDVIRRIRSAEIRSPAAVYVLDASRRLAGQVPLTALLLAPPETGIHELMTDVDACVTPDIDQEHAASIAVENRAGALPVVDDDRRLLGVVTAEALMDVLRAEHLEDLHRLSGVARDQQMAREAIEAPPMRRARHRLPWLLIGLAGSAGATMVMAGFESTLQASVAVAFFVPGIVYLADAIGTQTEAAAVRGLSLTREPLSQLVGGELRTGLLMGVTLAAITLPTVWLVFGDVNLAVAVAGALFCAGAMATTIGLLLPWFLYRLGRDPAYGSGPLATVIQDVLSIVIYLTIVTLIVG